MRCCETEWRYGAHYWLASIMCFTVLTAKSLTAQVLLFNAGIENILFKCRKNDFLSSSFPDCINRNLQHWCCYFILLVMWECRSDMKSWQRRWIVPNDSKINEWQKVLKNFLKPRRALPSMKPKRPLVGTQRCFFTPAQGIAENLHQSWGWGQRNGCTTY